MEKKTGDVGDFSGNKVPELVVHYAHADNSARDHFHEQLAKLNESSGLSFVFNFREALLDLHRLYEEVIHRGGYYQVTKIGNWDDVASTLNSKNLENISAAQLQCIYKTLLLQYELLHCREIPTEANVWPAKSSPGYSTRKRKQRDDSSVPMAYSGDVKGMEDISKHCDDSGGLGLVSGCKTMHNNSNIISSSNSNFFKEFTEIHEAPVKPRTGYQIFLKLETKRLKMIHGETSSSRNIQKMAIQLWRSFTEIDKQPYIEASKLDRERYEEEMAAYEQLQNNQNAKSLSMLSFSTPGETDDVYHVSMEATNCDDCLVSPDDSMVELAIETMKSAQSNDPMFQLDWGYSSFDIPYQMNDQEGTFPAGGA